MAPAAWRYYANQVAVGLEDYFTGRGEAPGRWTGSSAVGLGLAGEVDPTHLAALFGQGRDPLTGEALGRPFDHRAHSEVVAGYSLSLSDPTNASPVNFTVVSARLSPASRTPTSPWEALQPGPRPRSPAGPPPTTWPSAVWRLTGQSPLPSPPGRPPTRPATPAPCPRAPTTPSLSNPTAPTFDSVSAMVGITQVTATFSEPIACPTVSAADFRATVGGTPVAVAGSACTAASDPTIELTLATAPGSGQTVAISLVTSAGSVSDPAGKVAVAATRSITAADLTVTINQAAGQADPTNASSVDFTVVFSRAVTGFTSSDVTLGAPPARPRRW